MMLGAGVPFARYQELRRASDGIGDWRGSLKERKTALAPIREEERETE
jgi:hypothetical protein